MNNADYSCFVDSTSRPGNHRVPFGAPSFPERDTTVSRPGDDLQERFFAPARGLLCTCKRATLYTPEGYFVHAGGLLCT